jgi:hypothetical protein
MKREGMKGAWKGGREVKGGRKEKKSSIFATTWQ